MFAQIPPQIAALFSAHTLTWLTAGWLLIQAIGRSWHAIKSNGAGAWDAITSRGGLHGIWNALIFGTNIPTVKQVVAETIRQDAVAVAKEQSSASQGQPADTKTTGQ